MPSPLSPPPIAVIGGGITGLTAAWNLARAGKSVVVFEAAAVVGGAIGSTRDEGWLQEAGPNSLLEGSPEVQAARILAFLEQKGFLNLKSKI